MIQKYWTLSQIPRVEEMVKRYGLPNTILNTVTENLKILDAVYGADRCADIDGGQVVLILPELKELSGNDYISLLGKYHLTPEDVEFTDVLGVDIKGQRWKADTYILTEYALVIIYFEGGTEA